MDGYVEIDLSCEWKHEEGDGTVCAICEEQCWLHQWRLFIPRMPGVDGLVVCDGCHDQILMEEETDVPTE